MAAILFMWIFKMADCESQWITPEWKTPAFRKKIVAQIDDVIRQSGNPINKNSAEMESHVFNKAKTKDEYLSFVARLILHVREMNSSNKQANQGPPNPSGMPIGSSPNPDPINALQSMARQEGPLTYFPGPNMQISQALINQSPLLSSSLATQNPQLGAALSIQPPPGATAAANAIAHAAAAGMGMGGHPGMGPQPQGMPQGGFQNMMPGMPGRGQMAPNVTLGMPKPNMKQQQGQKSMQVMQQGQPPNMPPPIKPGNQMAMVDALMLQREQPQMSGGPGQFIQQNPQQIPRQGTPTQFLRQSPSPQINHMGMVPSPAQQQQQMPLSLSSAMTPSPAGYLQSQSPQIIPSPVAAPSVGSQSAGRTPGTIGAPSPGSALNTPMTAGGPVPSPVSRNQEDQAYLEKVKQLSKYIEPLKRMIARIDNDEDKKKDRSKMKNLLDILSNPTKRLQMDTLLKCEQVLEKMELKVKSTEAPAVVPSKEYNLCQPLYEAICAHIHLPTFSHTLHRTFGPAVSALHGERFHRSPPLKRKRLDDDAPDIPDVLQGEIARLDRRFKVTLNPIQHFGSRTVHLICQLDDKNLPCVPPITITVPENYPQQAPLCDDTSDDYESTQFLQAIHTNLLARLSKMPDQFSITTLLDTWEMSVRQACAPILTVNNESTE